MHNSKDGGRYVRKANSEHAHICDCSEPLLMLDPESSFIWGLEEVHQCKLKLSTPWTMAVNDKSTNSNDNVCIFINGNNEVWTKYTVVDFELSNSQVK